MLELGQVPTHLSRQSQKEKKLVYLLFEKGENDSYKFDTLDMTIH